MTYETELHSLAWDPTVSTLSGMERKKSGTQIPLTIYRAGASYYDWLMRVLRYQQTRRSILSNFLPTLPHRPTILEVGCGTGICTDAIKEFYSDAEIHGLDQSLEMLAIFQQRHPKIPVLRGDFNHPGLLGSHSILNPGTYDLVLSSGALSEYGRPEAYALVASLLKDRGIFLNIGIQRNAIGRLIGSVWGFRPTDHRSVISICRTAGFSEVSAYRLPWTSFPRTFIDVVVVAEKQSTK